MYTTMFWTWQQKPTRPTLNKPSVRRRAETSMKQPVTDRPGSHILSDDSKSSKQVGTAIAAAENVTRSQSSPVTPNQHSEAGLVSHFSPSDEDQTHTSQRSMSPVHQSTLPDYQPHGTTSEDDTHPPILTPRQTGFDEFLLNGTDMLSAVLTSCAHQVLKTSRPDLASVTMMNVINLSITNMKMLTAMAVQPHVLINLADPLREPQSPRFEPEPKPKPRESESSSKLRPRLAFGRNKRHLPNAFSHFCGASPTNSRLYSRRGGYRVDCWPEH